MSRLSTRRFGAMSRRHCARQPQLVGNQQDPRAAELSACPLQSYYRRHRRRFRIDGRTPALVQAPCDHRPRHPCRGGDLFWLCRDCGRRLRDGDGAAAAEHARVRGARAGGGTVRGEDSRRQRASYPRPTRSSSPRRCCSGPPPRWWRSPSTAPSCAGAGAIRSSGCCSTRPSRRCRSGSRPGSSSCCGGSPLDPSAHVTRDDSAARGDDGGLLRPQLRTACARDCARIEDARLRRVEAAVAAVGQLRRGRLRGLLFRHRDAVGWTGRGGGGDAAGRGASPHDSIDHRTTQRRREIRPDGRQAVSVHDRNACNRDRSEGRRHLRSHPSRAEVRDRAGEGARRHGREDHQGDQRRGAAARHGQAGRARAHSQQARQADGARVRADEAARRRRRRHPLVD